jgi:hypothetical protein
MKKALFIGIFAIITSAPAFSVPGYPAKGVNTISNSAKHEPLSPQTGVIPSKNITNTATPSRRHHKVYGAGSGVGIDTRVISPRNLRIHHRNSGVQLGQGLG